VKAAQLRLLVQITWVELLKSNLLYTEDSMPLKHSFVW